MGTGRATEEVIALFVQRHRAKLVDRGVRFAGEHISHHGEEIFFAGLASGLDGAGVEDGEQFDFFALFLEATGHFDGEIPADGPTAEPIRPVRLLLANRLDVFGGHRIDVVMRQAIVIETAGLDTVDGLARG